MSAQVPEPDKANGARSAVIWGFVLVLVGGGALAAQLWPAIDRYIPLAIGLGLLAIFAMTRSYGALVFGAILTGIGVGLVAADLFPRTDADGPAVTLGLGLGFMSIWVVSWLMHLKEHHFWPLIPGTILVLVGIGLSLDLFNQDWSDYVIPAIVLVLGVLLMVIGYLRSAHGGGTSA